MPPTTPTSLTSIKHVLPLSNILSTLTHRATAADTLTPLASVFALIIREPSSIHTRSLSALLSHSPHLDETLSPLDDATLAKRQVYVLAIPTTYAGLNAGPSPGVVVGIMLGSIAGFLLVGWIFLLLVRVYSGRIIEKETIIRTHRRTRSRSSHMSEARRRTTTTHISEEHVRHDSRPAPTQLSEDNEVVVEEEPDDYIEVIEEHSPERRESRRESRNKRSGYRTVDPAEIGGGDAPRRSISRR